MKTNCKQKVGFLAINHLGFLPYNFAILKSFADSNGGSVNAFEFKKQVAWYYRPLEEWVGYFSDVDILFASCYVWNFESHIYIADQLKRKNRNLKVIFGGPHIPRNASNFFVKHPSVDVVVHSEGELPFLQLLDHYSDEVKGLENISGISYNNNCQAVSGLPSQFTKLDQLTCSPYIDGLFDESIYKLNEKNINYFASWETTRGCPYGCSFCDWGNEDLNRIRSRNLDCLFEEIEVFGRLNVKDLVIADANFGILPRDLQITEKLVEAKANFGYPRSVRVNFAKNTNKNILKISRLLFESEMLWSTTFSQQSLNDASLSTVNRKNLGNAKYRMMRRDLSQTSIPTYSELIIPLPKETKKSFMEGICSLLEQGEHHDIRLYELSLLPNAPIVQKGHVEEYNIKSVTKLIDENIDNSCPDKINIAVATNAMSYEEYLDSYAFGVVLQVLHHGYYTQLISRYLRSAYNVSYFDFYKGVFASKGSIVNFIGSEIRYMQKHFIEHENVALNYKVAPHFEKMKMMGKYNSEKRYWTLFDWAWLYCNENIKNLYDEVEKYILAFVPQNGREEIADLISFQKSLMLTPDYDPDSGRWIKSKYNWREYFHGGENLKKHSVKKMVNKSGFGPNSRYLFKSGDLSSFVDCAVGKSYPNSKYGHFRLEYS